MSWALENEGGLRLSIFLAVFGLMSVWELLAARRTQGQSRARRWLANFGLSLIDALVVRLLFPAAAVGIAVFAEARGLGLLHLVDWPDWLEIALAVLLLDLVVYGQHVLFHAVPILWRVHRVHHTDEDLDATSGIRFHPVEIVLSMGIKAAAILLLGPQAFAVFLFEVLLNASSMWNHANIGLPKRLEQPLRTLLVTPDMHRIHHSIEQDESNRNFGFNLSWWDRLFGTYRAEPRGGQEAMKLGVEGFEERRGLSLWHLLGLPGRAPKP